MHTPRWRSATLIGEGANGSCALDSLLQTAVTVKRIRANQKRPPDLVRPRHQIALVLHDANPQMQDVLAYALAKTVDEGDLLHLTEAHAYTQASLRSRSPETSPPQRSTGTPQ